MKRFINLFILLVVLLFSFTLTSCNNETKEDGIIHLYVTIKDDVVVFNNNTPFYKGEHLIDVLNRVLKVEMGTGSNKGMIVGINDCTSPSDYSYYFKLIVNCKYASCGAEDLTLNNNDDIKILYSNINDNSTGC